MKKSVESTKIRNETREVYSFKQSEHLNLPDLQFYQWCNSQYGVNRGVFNTIDNWFYENGMINIHYRRIYLLAFLDYTIEEGIKQEQDKFIRFGNGGLTRELQKFYRPRKRVSRNKQKTVSEA
ncbi:hypothetical protein [Bacillus sinesaloumensis]|uniref:hypothetical protein n=1 Tax=Litchfieldia sinesaloumensis TaxID=1926280 RepID=UPI0009887643|nr:hypothetical protein [Bacillus sinesaloumensis]